MTDNGDEGERKATPSVTVTDSKGVQVGDHNLQNNPILKNDTSIHIHLSAPPREQSAVDGPAVARPVPEVPPGVARASAGTSYPGPEVGIGARIIPGKPAAPGLRAWQLRNKPAFRYIAVFVAISVLVFAVIRSNALSDDAPSSYTGQTSPSSQSASSATPSSTLQPISPSPEPPSPSPTPSTPSDPLSGVTSDKCFFNGGTLQDPDFQQDPACTDGDFQVAQVLVNTDDPSACEAASDDWDYVDDADDQVVCFTYLSDSPIYHAQINDCVFGPSDDSTSWSIRSSCSAGTFTVIGRYQGTADTSKCGSDMPESLTAYEFPNLDVLLCLQMNFPFFGTAAIGTCLLGTYDYPGVDYYSPTSCSEANAVIDSRTTTYNDAGFCGTDSVASWEAPGYSQYSYTTCIRWLNQP